MQRHPESETPSMNNIDRLRDVFDAVRDLETDQQRRKFLKDACGDDQVLLQRVDALLAADEEPQPESVPDATRLTRELQKQLESEKAEDKRIAKFHQGIIDAQTTIRDLRASIDTCNQKKDAIAQRKADLIAQLTALTSKTLPTVEHIEDEDDTSMEVDDEREKLLLSHIDTQARIHAEQVQALQAQIMANLDGTAKAEASKQAEQARASAESQAKALQDELRSETSKKKPTIANKGKATASAALPASSAKAAAEATIAKAAGIKAAADQSIHIQ